MLHGHTLQIQIDQLRPMLERHLREVIFRDGQCPDIKEIRGPSYSYESYIKVTFADAPAPAPEVEPTAEAA